MNDETTRIVLYFVILLISLVFHEVSHGFVASRLGDKTASDAGLVTLNPFPHMQREPFGTTILPLVMLIYSGGTMMMGFAHVPIDATWADRNPRKAALVAAAGPIANGILAGLAFLGLYLLVENQVADPWPTARDFYWFVTPADPDDGSMVALISILTTFLYLNTLLMVFNLMPWPPLDAHLILSGLFPKTVKPFYRAIAQQPLVVLVVFVAMIFMVFPEIFRPILRALINAF
ncbi:MAG: site-2 protease family protein [Planctomycetota bacterium]